MDQPPKTGGKLKFATLNSPGKCLKVIDRFRQLVTDPELLATRARIFYRTKHYDEALAAYGELLRIKPGGSIEKERGEVVVAQEFAAIDGLVRNGESRAAQERLEKLYRSGTSPYEAGYRLGALCLRERNYDRALQVYGELHSLYPADKGFEALRIESLMVTGNVDKAREALAALPATGREELYGEREELFYRVRPDYLLVKGEYDSFSRGFQDGNEFLVELSRRAGQVTLVPRYTHVSRFGLQNNQLGLDISSKVAEKSSIWGYLSLSYSPDAVFLPEWTAGATVYKGYRSYEFFAGYTRMSFPHADADIVNSGAIAYLPAGFALEGRLYVVPRQGSVTGAARVIYEPDHKVKAFYSLAVGQSAEKIIEQQDFRKLFTVTQRGGIEYRFRPSVGVGSELYYSYREHLYSTTGVSLFTRYWW